MQKSLLLDLYTVTPALVLITWHLICEYLKVTFYCDLNIFAILSLS